MPKARPSFREKVSTRLTDEVGQLTREGPNMVALAYPAAYRVGMSSLGFQTIYRVIQQSRTSACERVFAPDDADAWAEEAPLVSYESGRPLASFPVIAFSVAYELDLITLVRMLDASGVPPLREDRADHHPLVLVGGPLTLANPGPLEPFVDAVVMGEADELVVDVLDAVFASSSRAAQCDALRALSHVWVPEAGEAQRPPPCRAADETLPAWAPIRTLHTELRNMTLIEAVRGCSRSCQYCVMRRSASGGMRVVPMERILAAVPSDTSRVGLVGASVSDHPRIVEIVSQLADRRVDVGLSSLRADRLTMELVTALRRAGYRTITTALDGASERLRDRIERRTTEEQLLAATQCCRTAGIERLKLYLMVGLPDEGPSDIAECARFVRELSRLLPISLGVAAFCPKKNTALVNESFAGLERLNEHLSLLRRGLAGRAEVRATSTRWSWVESVLAQGGPAEGRALLEAVGNGGKFAAFKRAFGALGHKPS